MTHDALKASGLHFGYGKEKVIRGLSLSVNEGEFVGIIGPNGSGKSTLIKLLNGFVQPRHGDVSLFGKSLGVIGRRKASRIVSVVPQEVSFHFPYKVEEFVEMGRHPHHGFMVKETEEDRQIIRMAMEVTDTWRLKNRSVLELSGGEKQRVVLAAALAQDTRILFLDEPTSSLDIHYQIEIYDILKRMNAEKGLTVVAVTHDINLGALYSDRLVLLAGGKVVADGAPAQIVNTELIGAHFNLEVECGSRNGSNTPFILPTCRRIS